MIELPEERQVLDDQLLELLSEAIPAANPKVHTTTTATVPEIRAAVERMRNEMRTLPTWVVPVGTYVDSTIPVNVVHSPLVDAGYFIHIPVDAFDPPPGGHW